MEVIIHHVSVSEGDKEIVMKYKRLSNDASKRRRCQVTQMTWRYRRILKGRCQTILSTVAKDEFLFSGRADNHFERNRVAEPCVLNQSDAIWIF